MFFLIIFTFEGKSFDETLFAIEYEDLAITVFLLLGSKDSFKTPHIKVLVRYLEVKPFELIALINTRV